MTARSAPRLILCAVSRPPHDPASHRQEPTFGDLGDVRFRERGGGRHAPSLPEDRRWRWWMAGGIALLLLLVVLFRGPLADRVMPQTRAQALIEQGEAALAAGRLTAADGSGARERFEAAIAIDPDRPAARAGLARVAEAALVDARDALAQGRLEDARNALRMARELSVPRAQADALEAALREREAARAGLDGLFARAEAARAAGGLDGDRAALPLYARILALEPRHAGALRGREDALGALLDDARERLRGGDIDTAARAIATARRYDPGHVDLPDAQARLTEELDALRRRAHADFARGRLERAVQAWQALLRRDPADADALAGLQRAAGAYADRARAEAADFRFPEADAALRAASLLAPDSEAVRAAGAQLERARRTQRASAVALPAAERRQRVAALLREAAASEARGDLLSPPGDSAYDKLRAAQAIAPGDPAVARAVGRLLPAARRCYDAGLSANDLGRARGCLDARAMLGEDATQLARARTRLAQRWLAIGDERLGAGQVEGARAALAAARSLDPAVAGLADLRARVDAASAPGPAR